MLTGEKLHLYQMILAQLTSDGYVSAAQKLAEQVNLPVPDHLPKDYLATILKTAIRKDPALLDAPMLEREEHDVFEVDLAGQGVSELEATSATPETKYGSELTHTITRSSGKNEVFSALGSSANGQWVGVGTWGGRVEILAAEKLVGSGEVGESAVVRMYKDHLRGVTDVQFHPSQAVAVSGSEDKQVKLYRFSDSGSKKHYLFLQDTSPVRSVCFHPGGDHILVGTDHPMVRLYDVHSFKAFVSPQHADHHHRAVLCARFALDGSSAATAGSDGSIHLWDPRSMRCSRFVPEAHSAQAVTHVAYSRNGRYLLSSGLDSTVRLWDLRNASLFRTYSPPHGSKWGKYGAACAFTFDERHIAAPDGTGKVLVWNTEGGELSQAPLEGHAKNVRGLVSVPDRDVFISGGDDGARVWNNKST